METKRVLALDFGASSGRAIIGSFDGEKITLEEVHRFPNDPVILGGTMYWDFLRLFHEIKQSLIKAKSFGGISSIGIDTWGVDFGLIDAQGKLIDNPVHYRDSRTEGMLSETLTMIPAEELYMVTGNQFMEINTAFQLLSLSRNRPDILERADKLLLMPDLFTFFLTGEKATEQSIASTTQLYDQKKGGWAYTIAEKLGVKPSLFTNIVPSGSNRGTLSPEIRKELSLPEINVVSVCSHDTQSAMAAVPAAEKDYLFLSCGTWSLLGTELDEPVLGRDALKLGLSNEIGYGGKVSFLKNIIGLWLLQESRRQWQREGKNYSFAEMEAMAREEKPFACFIDPDAPVFTPAGNIPERIKAYCSETGQYMPQSDAEVIRCIYDSLSFKYASAISELQACTGKYYEKLYMIGGGARDKLLAQLTANACGIRVCTGPVEATALGNIAVQLIASGDIADIDSARRLIAGSENITEFFPEDGRLWNEAKEKYFSVITNKKEE